MGGTQLILPSGEFVGNNNNGGSDQVGLPVTLFDSNGVELNSEDGILTVNPVEYLTTFTAEYTSDAGGDVAAAIVITGLAGKHFGVQSVFIATEGASGSIDLDFATSSIKIIRAYPSKNTQSASVDTHIEGATAEGITFTATGIGNAKKVFISISYMIHTS